MRRSLVVLLAILSLSIFFSVERDRAVECVDTTLLELSAEDVEQSLSQGDSYGDFDGRRGSSSVVASKLVAKNIPSRRGQLDILSGVRIAVASLYSECGYSYSCDFPFEHQPQRELFFILRNIRI